MTRGRSRDSVHHDELNGGMVCVSASPHSIIGFLMSFLKDLWLFLVQRKKWWLAPVIFVLLILGMVLIFGGGSALAPFIYTLF